jgi:hypothetical protein
LTVLVIISLLSIGAAVTLSARETPMTDGVGAEEDRTSEVLRPNQDSSEAPIWV